MLKVGVLSVNNLPPLLDPVLIVLLVLTDGGVIPRAFDTSLARGHDGWIPFISKNSTASMNLVNDLWVQLRTFTSSYASALLNNPKV